MPLRFEPNRGQASNDVRYIGRAAGYKVGLGAKKITVAVPTRSQHDTRSQDVTLALTLEGSAANPAISAFGELPGKSNYLPTSDPRTWIKDVPTYSGVRYRSVYPKTDMVFHGDANRFEYDFQIAPGGDPSKIAWRVERSSDVQLRDGDLVLHSGAVELRFLKPVSFQEKNGKREAVSSAYRLRRDARGMIVEFSVGDYDRTRTLTIDPVLVYSTQVSALYDLSGIATDASGNVYIASASGVLEVAKMAPDGKTLLYDSTIGSSSATPISLAVDAFGRLCITGYANSGYVTTSTAYQPVSGSGTHAFLTVINAAGSALVYSTYLQGTSTDEASSIAIDPSGKVLIAGWTYSQDFPNTNNVTLPGYQTAFIAKFDITQSGNASLLYSALLPATSSTSAAGVKTDAAGNAYVAVNGYGLSTTAGAFNYDGYNNYYGGVYVAKLDAAGATQFLSYLGYGTAYDIAVDSAGNSYLTGTVTYGDFPTTPGAYQTSFPNAFVTKLNAGGTALVYSTFLGGPSGDVTPTSIVIPAACTNNCTPYISGYTSASDFPAVNAIQSTLGGYYDSFIVALSADATAATFSTYLGGTNDDAPYRGYGYHLPQVNLDGSGNIYLGSNTYSNDFPYTTPGSNYAFVVKIAPGSGAIIVPDKRSLNFNSQTLTVKSAAQTVLLRNLGSAAANISSITLNNAAFSQTNDCSGSVPAGSYCTLQVYFMPSVPGLNAATLSVAHDGNASPATVTMSGTGYDQPLLTLSPGNTVDFGAQLVNTSSSPITYTVTNIGTQPAQINSITMSGGHPEFSVISNCPGYLPAGASCTANVTFTPYSVGQFQSYIYVSANTSVLPNYYQYVTGTGIGIGASGITPSTTVLNFTDQLVGTSSPNQYVTFTNTGNIPLTIGAVTVTGDFGINYNPCGGYSYSPGDSCTIYVTFSPKTAGALTGTMTVKNSAGADQVITLNGVGSTAVPALVFSPSSVVFGDQVVGTESGTYSISITNNGNAPVTISRVYDSGGDFRVSYNGCSVISQYSSCNVNVSFTPTTTGPLNGTITFVDSTAGSPHTVSVSGNGVASSSSVIASPSAATFDDAVVGTNGPTDSFYLFNPGNAVVSASAPVSNSADFVVTYNGCATIYPASSCQINVQFRPQAPGVRTGIITMAHSATGSPTVINVSGTGLAVTDSLIATPLSTGFSDTVVGQKSSPQLIYFYNPGNTTVTVSNVSVSGDFEIYSNGCGNPGPSSYCYVYVRFVPTAAGNRTGTLTLFDTAPGSPHTASLSGNGVNPVSSLIATPSSLGFDDQVVGTTSGTTYITLYNPGNVAITVSNVSVSGDFNSSGCSSIPAGSYCSLPVTFTPTAAGQRTGTITLTDSAPGSPHGISVYGNGLAATTTIAVTPGSLDFGNVVTSVSAPAQTVYVTNTGNKNVTISAVTASSPFTVSGCITTISPGASCSMSVSLNTSTTGAGTGSLTLTDNASGSPHSVALTANGVATTPSVSVSPNGLTFPKTVMGVTSNAITATFQNRSGASITVSGVSATGDFAVTTNNCTTVATNANCGVSVKFTPTASGNRGGTLVFTHNGPGGSTTINLSGYGNDATSIVQMSASALAFPDQVVGTASGTQTVYLWNNGTVPYTPGAVSITPSDFVIVTNGCTSAVNPGSYCYVNVKFQPTSAGTITGALTIVASDPGSPHVVTLSGVGITQTKTLAFSASAIQYTDQAVGYVSGTQTLSVFNTGNGSIAMGTPAITGDYAITYNGCPTTSFAGGGTCYVNITFTPTATGTRTGALTFSDDAAGTPHAVALSGTGIAATKKYALTALAFGFPDQPLAIQSSTQYAYLYNTGTAPLVLSGSTITGDFVISYNGCPATTIAVGSSCTVGVLFKPTVSGVSTGTLTIGTDSPDGAAVITLSGNGVDQIKSARVSTTALNFADQAVGTTSDYQYFYVYNTGNVPLTISSVTFSGDYSSPYGYCSGTISVGSYCYMYVSFTPTQSGTRTGTITIADDSSTSPHVVSLTGNGLAPSVRINVTPGSLVFPPTPVGTLTTYSYVIVTNVGNAPVQMNSATVTGADFKLYSSGCDSRTLPVGGYTCYVYVQFQPTATGALTGTLTITDNATGNPHTVPLSGTGTDPSKAFQLSQTSVTFASQPTGTTSAPSIVYLVNQGSTPVTISNVAVTGDFQVTNCTSGTVYQSSNCGMYIYFKPTQTGPLSGSVTITDNATGSPHVILLSGTGVAPFPIANPVPNAIAFSDQIVGATPKTQVFTLYNTGTAPLNVTDVSTTTSDFSATRNCITTIAANSYCQVTVQFAPLTSGAKTAAVQITDNATGSPHLVTLTGNGTGATPLVQLSADTFAFSNQSVNTTSAEKLFTVTNIGNANLVVSNVAVSGLYAISTNTCATVAASATCNIGVTFTPTIAGVATGTLSIVDNAPGSPHVIGLSGTGLAGPSITVSPGSLVFNSQQVGTTSAAQTISLTNSGSTATISSISIPAGPFTQTNSCTTIGSGGTCNISVKFSPATAGPLTATLTVVDDSPTSPHNISLSGNGVGQPAVSLTSTSLDFGNQNVGTTSTAQTVTMTNSGAGPLAVGTISAGGDYSVSNDCGNNLAVSASCTISVTFHPSGANTRTGTISIADNAPNTPQTISLTGVGIGAVPSLSTTSLPFGSQMVGTTSAAQTTTLTNTGNVALNISSIVSTNAVFAQTNDCGATLAANAFCTISVTFTPTAAASQGGYISISTDAGAPLVSLSGSGTGPVGTVNPTSLSFGSVSLNTASATQDVTLNSTGTTALTVGTISASGDFSQTNACPSSLAVAASCLIHVTFTPTAAGSRSGTLFISDNGSAGGHQVSLIGIGLGPSLSLSPSSLPFGTVALGTTASPQSITVTNNGTVTITGLSVSAATGDYAQTNNCPASLAVNATCSINVTFTPTVAGTRNGGLSVTSSAATQSASFTGAGSGPLVQLSTTSLSFGNIVSNTSSTAQNVTLTNGGNATLNIATIAASGDYSQTNNCPAALAVNSFCTIAVTFTPTANGLRTGTVAIADDAGDSPQVISLSGTGIVPQEDLAITGAASPASIQPGGSTAYTFTITNNGPSTATGVSFTATTPTNTQVTGASSPSGNCVISTSITCSLADLPLNGATTVTISATATAIDVLSTTASVSAAESDPNTSNNSVTVTAVVGVSDLVLSASNTASATPSYLVTLTNNGPAGASNVTMACAYDRFGFSSVSSSQGSCTFSGGTLNCSFGSLASGATINITQAVQPPSTGWATIACHAKATEFDPNLVNNSAQISPEGGTNTTVGDNVGVQLYDGASGAAARIVFPSVRQSGVTTLSSVAGSVPPAGFRSGSQARTYDVSTTATTVGSPVVTFAVATTQFRHPERVRLFHMENGAWVDRTIGMDPATSTVAAIAGSLSPFALFEPVNHAPLANAGTDRVVPGVSVLGAAIVLDAAASADADGDALNYRWTGPFAEGNGAVSGARPSVTLPFGTSKLTLIANDGETDSAPVTIDVTVTDFGIAAGNTSIALARGGSVTVPIQVDARGGAFDRPVTLGCANLPAGMTCTFSPSTVQPGSNGAASTLTIAATATAAAHRQTPPWSLGGMLFGAVGVVMIGGKRRRHALLLTLALLALVLLVQVGCGGGGMASSAPTNSTTHSSTVTVTVTGTSAGLAHSSSVNVTLQ